MSTIVALTPDRALPGRPDSIYPVPERNIVLDVPLLGPFPPGTEILYLGAGCFWGVEKEMWSRPGVVGTAVGYQGGFTPHPTYEEVCTGRTGHAEIVMVAYDPTATTPTELLRHFWQMHDPTQGYRQGNDVGTQYRSALYYTTDTQLAAIDATMSGFSPELARHGFGTITTEIRPVSSAGTFYPAEAYHQQYLEKNPTGYCPVHATGIACPMPTALS